MRDHDNVFVQLPAEIRPPGWGGPTLFTRADSDGRYATLRELSAALREHEHAESLVIGTMRETQLLTPIVYAAFCVEPTTENIVLVDLDEPFHVRFVNRGIDELVASLELFVSRWPRIVDADDAHAPAIIEQLTAELAAIDAAAVSDRDAFWPTALEVYGLS